MKTLLIVAAAIGFSTSFAAADCPAHANKQSLASVDKQTTTASVASTTAGAADKETTTADAPVILPKDEEAKTE